MANPEHLEILKQGVEVWNKWRQEHRKIKVLDLSDADLRHINLSYANLRHANLRGANISSAHLIGAHLNCADLNGADLGSADLKNAHINGAHLIGAHLIGAHFSGAHLKSADFSGADLRLANFSNANLTNAHLRGADLTRARLNSANLRDANLIGADLTGTYFINALLRGANLINANLRGANLINADFSNAHLRGAHLIGAHLSDADLSGADLSGADFSGADLRGVDLKRSIMTDAEFAASTMGGTTLAGIDLSEAKGLENVRHSAPSTIGIDTLYKSAGKMPEAFLRGCGMPDDFIAFIPSHFGIQQAINFYSCFISYSHKDEEFARRLYSRMRDAKLRVWYAPEEMKGGEKIHEQIFNAIHLHDKLLLILSEESLKSEWVMTEIRRARKAEREENRRKLFPIKLVDFDAIQKWECFDADNGKDLAVEMREYFIPDFSNWKDHDAFEKAFDRLLRDLKAEDRQAAEE